MLVEIQKSQSDTYYDNSDRRKTVFWEPRMGLETSEGGKQSPATRLEHEFDHAVFDIINSGLHNKLQNTSDTQYGNAEERRVITGDERETAKKLKESPRRDHFGKTYKVKNSYTTDLL